ncbi:polysaccharide biosynthesis tyrosine autokinase [Nocardioides acrostichi]|uniref:non-specific protein-tyrosine kinase n=1 Tax=Nocardioides acrostichi TaxID=2784339 RepID=A0A930V1X6_9ACTN|nr:polysaccharide biosynthesis tyrosine autokinase [Nocardioides acrostichi]MBF4162539.1 polysaccharide biosynthesis tyrosine autokinase [Nocardioides acrostichi]
MVEFLTILRRRWRILVAMVVLGVAAAGLLTTQMTPTYRATAQLFVAFANTSSDDTALSLSQGNLFAANRVKSYPDLVSSPLVLQPVIDDLELDESPEELAGRVSAQVPPNTVLIEVYADDENPGLAAKIANDVSKNLITVVEDLDRIKSSDASPVRVSLTREAVPPTSPRSPVPVLNLSAGLLLGLALGLGLALLRDSLDTTIKDDADVESATGLTTLASVPVNPDINETPVIQQGAASPVWSESYRKLRTNISYLSPDDPPRSLLVTSALQGDGKTVTAANLAASLAQSGRHTILVDADLRRPSVAKLLGLVPDVGVTSIVTGKATLADVMQHAHGFDVVASGPIPPNPSELLESQMFRGLVESLLEEYDSVIVDTPPLVAVTDAAVVATAADAVIVVARANRTKAPELRRALLGLRAVDARIAGVVLNRVTMDSNAYYQYSYKQSGKSRR